MFVWYEQKPQSPSTLAGSMGHHQMASSDHIFPSPTGSAGKRSKFNYHGETSNPGFLTLSSLYSRRGRQMMNVYKMYGISDWLLSVLLRWIRLNVTKWNSQILSKT